LNRVFDDLLRLWVAKDDHARTPEERKQADEQYEAKTFELWPLVHEIASRSSTNRDEAQEITQTILLRLLTKLGGMKPDNFTGWVWTVRRRLEIDRERSRVSRPTVPLDAGGATGAQRQRRSLIDTIVHPGPNPEQRYLAKELAGERLRLTNRVMRRRVASICRQWNTWVHDVTPVATGRKVLIPMLGQIGVYARDIDTRARIVRANSMATLHALARLELALALSPLNEYLMARDLETHPDNKRNALDCRWGQLRDLSDAHRIVIPPALAGRSAKRA
jgi:DNA-directed RNA polymerase specialized sigma24 family protein